MADSLTRLERKYLQLKETLLSLGPVLQGNIIPRIIRSEAPDNPGQWKDYGPYYQWTRKREGKTVTQNLSPSQSKVYANAIIENKKLEKTLMAMREISLKILELTTEGVPKRKRKK